VSKSQYDQLSQEGLRQLNRLVLVQGILDERRKRGIYSDIVVCPVCKSTRVIEITSFNDLGYIGGFQPGYYCLDCGWYGRTIVIMTNRPENDAVLEDMQRAFGDLQDDGHEGSSIDLE
jgi:hypothetical protein